MVPTDPATPEKRCKDKDWTVLDDPKEIEKALLHRNRQHFGSAQSTPFTEPPLREEVDFTGASASSQLILQGRCTTDISAIPSALIQKLAIIAPISKIKSELSMSDLVNELKNWNEKTPPRRPGDT